MSGRNRGARNHRWNWTKEDDCSGWTFGPWRVFKEWRLGGAYFVWAVQHAGVADFRFNVNRSSFRSAFSAMRKIERMCRRQGRSAFT